MSIIALALSFLLQPLVPICLTSQGVALLKSVVYTKTALQKFKAFKEFVCFFICAFNEKEACNQTVVKKKEEMLWGWWLCVGFEEEACCFFPAMQNSFLGLASVVSGGRKSVEERGWIGIRRNERKFGRKKGS